MTEIILSEAERAFMEEWCALRGIRSKEYYRNLTDQELFNIYEERISLEQIEVYENIKRIK